MQSFRFYSIQSQLRRSYRSIARSQRRRPLPLPRRVAPVGAKTPISRNSDEGEEKVKINFFEEDDGPNPKRRRVEVEEDPEDAEVRQQMKDLEQDIEGLKIGEEMPEELAQLFSNEEREAGRKLVDKELAKFQLPISKRGSQAAIFDELGVVDILPYQVAPNDVIPRQSQILLNRLNEALDTANLDPSQPVARKDVSRWYSHSKARVASFIKMIPDAGWDLLWAVQSQDNIHNPNRASHLRVLANDMLAAGRRLTIQQRLARLEGLFLDGKQDEAITQWEEIQDTEDGRNPDFLELGVRMLSKNSSLDRAHEVLGDLFTLDITHDPRVIIPLINAHNRAQDPQHFLKSWKLYLELKDRLSSDMSMAEYDEVTMSFLAAGQKDLALAVFRDMMLSGDADSRRMDSAALDRIGQIISASSGAEDVNETSLSALSFLPRRLENKFFYAKWLKKLIGMGEIDSAAQVIELMYERGVPPNARHMNGLVTGWLRQGNSHARQKAEVMAWAMVQERLDFTARRMAEKTGQEVPKKSIYRTPKGISIPTFVRRQVPTATIETFSVLVQHYLRRDMLDHVRHLRDLLWQAEIPMNSYFMNHLLYGTMRTGAPSEVWSRFIVLTRTVQPDIESFVCLWDCMKFAVDTSRNPNASGFPTPRQLLAKMMDWYGSLSGRVKREAKESLESETYEHIVRSFCLKKDLPGAFVAMQVLKESFGKYPDQSTARMLVLHISRLNTTAPKTTRQKKAISTSATSKINVAQTAQVLRTLMERRRADLEHKGYEASDLSDNQRAEEHHRLMLELLFVVLLKRLGGVEHVQNSLENATEDMGVKHLDLDEIMAPAI